MSLMRTGNLGMYRPAFSNASGMYRGASIGGDEAPMKLLEPEDIPGATEFDPTVSLFFGRRGDGKTLCMTFLLAAMKRRYIKSRSLWSRDNLDGFRLATNYQVQFAELNDPYIVDKVSSYDDGMRRLYMALDEVLSYMPSRRSMARTNVDFTNFLVQIRKLDTELVSTTQMPQNLDSQLLQQIDCFMQPILFNKKWLPKRDLWTHKKTGEMIYRATSARILVWDWWGNLGVGRQVYKRWPPSASGELPDCTWDWHGLDNLFSWFSTKEQVPSIWHRNRDTMLSKNWQDFLGATATEYAPTDVVQEKEEGPPPATLDELIAAQPDLVPFNDLFDLAKDINKSLGTSQLAGLLESHGYTIEGKGRQKRAVKIPVEVE